MNKKKKFISESDDTGALLECAPTIDVAVKYAVVHHTGLEDYGELFFFFFYVRCLCNVCGRESDPVPDACLHHSRADAATAVRRG